MAGRSIRSARYRPKLTLRETERGIKLIKDSFERRLASGLNLERVSAPRFLEVGDGLQDDLAGTQVPVSFRVPHAQHPLEMVHSLAKWKRMALGRYGFGRGTGLYTDMDAVRKDEVVDETHSTYVDQWDWELVIGPEDRNLEFLKAVVRRIYGALLETEEAAAEAFPALQRRLSGEIRFVHAQELEDRYPELSPPQREDRAAAELGAFFLVGIGAPLRSGVPHDLRAADYDDWISVNGDGLPGLNGDIIVWDASRERGLELSSMGIRVDAHSLRLQLEATGSSDRLGLEFHRRLLAGELPLSIGGGIGQSRLCMLLLHKVHIGEVQVAVWPPEMRQSCAEAGIPLL
jgi:aspartate--ammonia ligase